MMKMPLSLSEMLRENRGINTAHRVNPLLSQAGITAARVLNGNPMRISLIIQNLSAAAVYVSTLPNVASTSGIYLAPNGGAMALKWDVDGELVASEYWVRASAAASDIYCIEVYSV